MFRRDVYLSGKMVIGVFIRGNNMRDLFYWGHAGVRVVFGGIRGY